MPYSLIQKEMRKAVKAVVALSDFFALVLEKIVSAYSPLPSTGSV